MTDRLLETFPVHLDPLRFLSGHRATIQLLTDDTQVGAQCVVDQQAADPAPALDQAGTGMTVWSPIFWDVTGLGELVAKLHNTAERDLTIRVAWECGESDEDD